MNRKVLRRFAADLEREAEVREKVIRRYMERMEIPEKKLSEIMALYADVPHVWLCMPFIIEDVRAGAGKGIICDRYAVTPNWFRVAAVIVGRYKPVRF